MHNANDFDTASPTGKPLSFPDAGSWTAKPRLLCGLMSGTSLDGIDAALVRFSTDIQGRYNFELLTCETVPMPDALRSLLSRLITSESLTIAEVSQAQVMIAQAHAMAVRQVCGLAGIEVHTIDAAGMHGQTVWHAPGAMDGNDSPGHSLQLGSGPTLAQLLRVPVVTDFRNADVALGGQGAPLVPLFDYTFLRRGDRDCIALNIGGMANITIMPAGGSADSVRAFDTGPGNILIDLATHKFFGKPFDTEGKFARAGAVIPRLMDSLRADPFVTAPPPKSTGREYYNADYLERRLLANYFDRQPAEDAVRTFTEFSAWSIAENIRRFGVPAAEVVVSGGGIHNLCLMEALQRELPAANIIRCEERGIPADAKEAIAFAFLAYRTLGGLTGSMPSVTGAARAAVLGSISPA